MKTEAKEYWKFFRPSACSLKLKGSSQEEIFEEILANFVGAKLLPEELRAKALETLLERERTASTGVGRNVAIPHVKLAGIDSALVSLSLHPDGVEWNSLDGEPATIFFTVLRPEAPSAGFDHDKHLDMMRWISNLGRAEDFRRFAHGVTTRTALVDLLKEMSSS